MPLKWLIPYPKQRVPAAVCAAHCGAHVSILLQDDDDGATARTREVGPRRVGGGGAREGRGAEKPALFGSESDERIQKQVVSGGQAAVGDVGDASAGPVPAQLLMAWTRQASSRPQVDGVPNVWANKIYGGHTAGVYVAGERARGDIVDNEIYENKDGVVLRQGACPPEANPRPAYSCRLGTT